jgi:hypothetical protein
LIELVFKCLKSENEYKGNRKKEKNRGSTIRGLELKPKPRKSEFVT